MKHFITFVMLTTSFSIQAQTLLIAKVASPSDEKTNGKFVTIYNPTNDTINFETTTYYLAKETNGGGSISNKKLVGKIAPSAYYVIAGKAAFKDVYLNEPDCIAGCVTGNGNDAYMLYMNGDQTTGTLVDIYGEVGVDGLGLDWDYTDALANRIQGVNGGLSKWHKDEWVISKSILASNANPWNRIEPTSLIIQKHQSSPTVNAYPNPCNQIINIESKYQILNISVISISGQAQYHQNNIDSIQAVIDSSIFPSGLYFVNVQLIDNRMQTLILVKR